MAGKATGCRGWQGPCAERPGRGSARPRAQNRNHLPAPVAPGRAGTETQPGSHAWQLLWRDSSLPKLRGDQRRPLHVPSILVHQPPGLGPFCKDTELPSTLGLHPALPILDLLFQRDKGISGTHLHQEMLINSSRVLQALAQAVTHVSRWAEDSKAQSSHERSGARQGWAGAAANTAAVPRRPPGTSTAPHADTRTRGQREG